MVEFESIEPYMAIVGDDIFLKWNGSVPIWSSPNSDIHGAVVVDEIKKSIEATVIELQKDTESCRILRAKIRYGEGKEGWVLYDALIPKKAPVLNH